LRFEPTRLASSLRGGVALACSSPERFLQVAASGQVQCKPIKGTRRRAESPTEDAAHAAALAASRKDRAENLMIVDLIRNDISRVCVPGSVHVPSLMAVETFATVHQMVSTVVGTLLPSRDALDAVAACFPPGSMTGAPKVRTVHLLRQLEQQEPRGVYSGTLGFFSVHGAADLNVVIRTAMLTDGSLAIGAGGAIVALSEAEDEWAEVLLKARPVMRAVALHLTGDEGAYDIRRETGVAAPPTRPGSACLLLETMRFSVQEGFFLLDAHLERMAAAAVALGFAAVDRDAVERLLQQEAARLCGEHGAGAFRVRLLQAGDGELQLSSARLEGAGDAHPAICIPPPAPVVGHSALPRVRLDSVPVCSSDLRLCYKTTSRGPYEEARTRAGCQPGAKQVWDALLWNEAGELTECALANVAVQVRDGRWRTPPLDCGLLPGIMRQALLQGGHLHEEVLTVDDLKAAVREGRGIMAMNSVRGCYQVAVELGE
jgi:branched-subunit amino acid aminotransferase/4-amino-4-deoxychorismate lyase